MSIPLASWEKKILSGNAIGAVLILAVVATSYLQTSDRLDVMENRLEAIQGALVIDAETPTGPAKVTLSEALNAVGAGQGSLSTLVQARCTTSTSRR